MPGGGIENVLVAAAFDRANPFRVSRITLKDVRAPLLNGIAMDYRTPRFCCKAHGPVRRAGNVRTESTYRRVRRPAVQ